MLKNASKCSLIVLLSHIFVNFSPKGGKNCEGQNPPQPLCDIFHVFRGLIYKIVRGEKMRKGFGWGKQFFKYLYTVTDNEEERPKHDFLPQFQPIFTISNPPLGPKFSYNISNLCLGQSMSYLYMNNKQEKYSTFELRLKI